MNTRIEPRPNDEWVAALRDGAEESSSLIDELFQYVRRVLGSTLARRKLDDQDLSDLTQEAMLQLVRSLHTFRGDSAFMTWAASVATRSAFTELRRRAARESKHRAFKQARAHALERRAEREFFVEDSGLTRESVLQALHVAIDTDLTERQRIATLALLRGVPTIEIAEQLESNQNAVYKLVHDARLRLREALQNRGITGELIAEWSEEEQLDEH